MKGPLEDRSGSSPHGTGKMFWSRALEILRLGEAGVESFPPAGEVAELTAEDRRPIINQVRINAYALSSVISEASMERALAAAPRYPPYGLAKSLFTDIGMLSTFPEPVPEGGIADFRGLGKAYIDTMVFHLDAELKELRKSDRDWIIKRLTKLLALLATDVSPANRARLRDVFTFIYGGLQFGASTCVQLLEVMAGHLAVFPELSAKDKATVISRSSRPAYQLSALNVDDIVPAYRRLQPAPSNEQEAGPVAAGWMDPKQFVIEEVDGRPWRIAIKDESILKQRDPGQRPLGYETQGCPARVAPSGGRSPISALWTWSVEIAKLAGLFEGTVQPSPP